MIDAAKYPMLTSTPSCAECGATLIRVTLWHCPDCDAEPETDAQVDGRLQSDAERTFELVQSR